MFKFPEPALLDKEIVASRVLDGLSVAELRTLLGTNEIPTLIGEENENNRSLYTGGEALFTLQSSIIGGLTGIGQEQGATLDEALVGFTKALLHQDSPHPVSFEGTFSTAFLWLKDYTNTKFPVPEGLRQFSATMNAVRAATPIFCCALACAQRLEDKDDFAVAFQLGTEAIDRQSWQQLTDRVKSAVAAYDKIQNAWLNGVADLPPSEVRKRYVFETRCRRNLMRTFFITLRQARSTTST